MAELDDYLHKVQAELDAAGGDDPYLLVRVGSTLGSLGPPERALAMLERAAALYEQRGEYAAFAEALNRMSVLLSDAGRRRDARAQLMRSLEVARAHAARSEEASALNNLSLLDEDDGEHARAMERQQQCIAILRELGSSVATALPTCSTTWVAATKTSGSSSTRSITMSARAPSKRSLAISGSS
ncbi:MAG TPA: tetratricopeptide repeat protein [Myxococcota bacterium]